MHSTDTHGNQTPAMLRITIDPAATSGVSLGQGRDLMSGETADVPYYVAVTQIRAGRARLASDVTVRAEPDAPASPVVVETRDPVVQSAAPKPRSRR